MYVNLFTLNGCASSSLKEMKKFEIGTYFQKKSQICIKVGRKFLPFLLASSATNFPNFGDTNRSNSPVKTTTKVLIIGPAMVFAFLFLVN